ncbi:MAG: histidine phosphatase family protein [Clostridiales bacterium]|nr:histidine phosphatase family protein [Clostridiales bacterium]
MKQIITIQHTQSVHHTNGMVGSWTDWHLTELGRAQAERIAQRLLPLLQGKAWKMYSSDLLRAQETAAPLAAELNVTPILRSELRERNLGPAVGKSVQWLRENLEMQERTVDDRLFAAAESRRDAWNRLLPLFEEIMNSEDENIILVSHGDLLSIFNVMWLGLPAEAMNGIDLFGSAGGVSFFYVAEDRADPGTTKGKRVIRRLSDMSFVNE